MGNTKERNAFTIVELLIVIVIIAILAAITIIGYSVVIRNANDKSVQTDLQKLGDVVKLSLLDNQIVPQGGMTSGGVGTATTFSGITFHPIPGAYDKSVSNLYYCEGSIGSGTTDEFGIIARSTSKNAFVYLSTNGVSTFSANVWTTASNGVAICNAAGFTTTFTWAYGYNASTSTWSSWSTP